MNGPDPEVELPFTDHPTAQFIQDMSQIADSQPSLQSQPSFVWNDDALSFGTYASSMVVPKRAIAEDLLNHYEQYVYPLFPILHMPTFRQSYESLWESQRRTHSQSSATEATLHATLNTALALGCLIHSNVKPQLKLRTADAFYQRARVLWPLDALDVPSLGVVQCLLLTVNYLSFPKYSNGCRNTLAVAIRVAQTLGLHMDVEAYPGNQLKREMSRRV